MKYYTWIKYHFIKMYTFPYKKLRVWKTKGRVDILQNWGGTYTIVDCLPDKPIVFSFGIGDDIRFEKKVLEVYPKGELYAFDPTPKSQFYADKLSGNHKFHFEMTGLSDRNGTVKFFLPNNQNHISASTIHHDNTGGEGYEIDVPMCSLYTLMQKYNVNHIDLLKIDIEGTEFTAIPQFLLEGIFPKQICVELHERYYKRPLKVLKELLGLIEQKGYKLVFLSKSQAEFTFLRE